MKKSMKKVRLALALLLAGVSLRAQPQLVQPDFAAPLLRDWVQPEYPAEARKAKTEGRVIIEFVVETDGSVTREKIQKSSEVQFDDAALTAARKWRFSPGLDEGKPVAMAMKMAVVFDAAQLSQKQPPLYPPERFMPSLMQIKPAQSLGGIDPDYPAELEERKLPGEVLIEFTVDEEGRMRLPKVLSASHPAFVESALRTLARAGFEPARQGPLPKASKMKFPVVFDSTGAKPADILQANRLEITGVMPRILPQVLMLITPVYPRDRLLAAEKGTAVVGYTVNEEGRTVEVIVLDASTPEFGKALKAAVESWAFRPGQSDEGPIETRMKATHEFTPEANATDARLAGLMQPGGAGISGATGLDQKLQPLWRGFPVYPQSLRSQRLAGEVQIEFIIDREGRARLPRVLKANEEAFGWAAATAISQWVFAPPMRGGEAVDVRVSIPVNFGQPAD